MEKSAVEWLVEQLKINNYISDNAHWLIDEAKEFEKEQKNNFAIEFAEWICEKAEISTIDGKMNTTLEIFKKEKGL